MTPSNAQCDAEPNAERCAERHGHRQRGVDARPLRKHRLALSIALATALAAPAMAHAASPDTETLVFLRHGEKPAKGYGQLDCQGLNRALALPAVIAAKFGKPDAIYAPNPSMQKRDDGELYDYVRPLAMIEPTAIQYALPVRTAYGYAQIDALERALVKPEYRGKLIVTAWEHREIEDLVRDIVNRYGDGQQEVPRWASKDFDSMYVVKLHWAGENQAPRAIFSLDREGLDGRSKDCPCAALPDAPDGASR